MRRTNTVTVMGLLGLALLVASLLVAWVEPVQAQEPQAAAATQVPDAAGSKAQTVAKGKKKEVEYTGPNTLVELAPTPMLDEEGMQRQDPDGKPMFNPPVKQQRDKKGHPLFDAAGKPVMQTKDNLGYDESGKKLHAKKEKPPKLVSVSISRGILTVDGMTGKAALNYEIKDLQYIYIYAAGIGTTVVSIHPFPGAVEQKHAFDDKTLTVTVNDHTLQVSSDKRILGKAPASAFVRVDKGFVVRTEFPVMGYGSLRVAPYAWPGSKENESLKGVVEAPPLPMDLRPVPLLAPCPAGQMRMPGAMTTPGQAAVVHPCVPIAAASAKQVSAQAGNSTVQR